MPVSPAKNSAINIKKEVKVQANTPKASAKSNRMVAFTAEKPVFTQESFDRALTVVLSVLMILVLSWFALWYIPKNLYPQTGFAKAEQAQKQTDVDAKILASKQEELKAQRIIEDAAVAGKNIVVMQTNFGDLTINLARKTVPVTTDNFARLVYRKNYDNNKFHRIVKQPNFAVIPGGDFEGQTGGALSKTINDEVWTVVPTYDEAGKLTNTPVFTEPSLYKDYKDLGVYQGQSVSQVIYPKGTIIMAKAQAPNTAGSQYFITLVDTQLQPDYTAFGSITPESFAVLDKIYNEVGIVDKDGKATSAADGKPDRELKIITALLQ